MKLAAKTPRYAGQIQSYVTGSALPAYINDRYGPGWSLTEDRQLAKPGKPLLMADFRPGVGCCSLTALTYLLDYHHRAHDCPANAGTLEGLFTTIENEATHHGYSLTKGRMNPLRISSLARAAWQKSGCKAQSRSLLLIRQQVLKDEISQDRPLLLNIAFGYYRRHTVTVAGYQAWQHKRQSGTGSRELLFLKVLDGWTREERYIDLAAMRCPLSGDFTPFSLTLVWPEV